MVVAQRILSFLRHILPYSNLVCGGHSCQAIFVVLSMVYNKLHISSYTWNMINWLLNLKWNLSVSLEFIAVLSISTFYSICERRWSLHDQLFELYRTHICFLWLLFLVCKQIFKYVDCNIIHLNMDGKWQKIYKPHEVIVSNIFER